MNITEARRLMPDDLKRSALSEKDMDVTVLLEKNRAAYQLHYCDPMTGKRNGFYRIRYLTPPTGIERLTNRHWRYRQSADTAPHVFFPRAVDWKRVLVDPTV